jgi:hypothetical protein
VTSIGFQRKPQLAVPVELWFADTTRFARPTLRRRGDADLRPAVGRDDRILADGALDCPGKRQALAVGHALDGKGWQLRHDEMRETMAAMATAPATPTAVPRRRPAIAAAMTALATVWIATAMRMAVAASACGMRVPARR